MAASLKIIDSHGTKDRWLKYSKRLVRKFVQRCLKFAGCAKDC